MKLSWGSHLGYLKTGILPAPNNLDVICASFPKPGLATPSPTRETAWKSSWAKPASSALNGRGSVKRKLDDC